MSDVQARQRLGEVIERADLDELTDGILASFAERPEFQSLNPPREQLRPWVRWNVDLVARWLRDGRGPSDEDLAALREVARSSAADGSPVDTVPANYRIGARFAMRALIDASSDRDRLVLLDSGEVLLEFLDLVTRVFTDEYEAAARAAGPSAADVAAQALISRLAHDESPLEEERRFAEQIGFDLFGPARPFVLSAALASNDEHTALAGRLRQRGVLAASRGRRVHGVANRPVPWREVVPPADAAYAEGEPAMPGRLGAGLDELRAVVEVATARDHRGAVAPDQYLAEAILRRSPGLSHRLEERVYKPLRPDLSDTLDALVEHNFDRAAAAASLPVHRNTLTNRMIRIRELTGVDVEDANGRGVVWLAWLIRSSRRAEG
jgi:hypothetical protein